MKVLLITLLLVGTAFTAVIQQKTRGSGPNCPIDDPLTVEPGNINTTKIAPILVIDVGSVQDGAIATGLTTLFYEYEIDLLTLSFTASAGLTADIKGDNYEATGSIDATPFSSAVVPSGPFEGKGPFSGSITGGFISGNGAILVNLITNRISIWQLEITEITFDNIVASLGGFSVGDVLIDFTEWSANIKANFDAEWATVGADFVEKVRVEVVNVILGQYTLAEFLEIIGETGTPAPCATGSSF